MPCIKKKKMKRIAKIILLMLVIGSLEGFSDKTVNVPNSKGESSSKSIPKSPQKLYIEIIISDDGSTMLFNFPESIKSLNVTLVDLHSGNVKIGFVTQDYNDWQVNLLPGIYSILCISDSGIEFETKFAME